MKKISRSTQNRIVQKYIESKYGYKKFIPASYLKEKIKENFYKFRTTDNAVDFAYRTFGDTPAFKKV
jgi:hypothetical protein